MQGLSDPVRSAGLIVNGDISTPAMNLHAMSRRRACRLRSNRTCGLISISTPLGHYDQYPARAGWAFYLDLKFHDVKHVAPDYEDGYVRFNAGHAHKIVEGALLCRDQGVEDLVIHCDMGLSRSVAVAESLREAGLGQLCCWETSSTEQANTLVLSFMRKALDGKISTPGLDW